VRHQSRIRQGKCNEDDDGVMVSRTVDANIVFCLVVEETRKSCAQRYVCQVQTSFKMVHEHTICTAPTRRFSFSVPVLIFIAAVSSVTNTAPTRAHVNTELS